MQISSSIKRVLKSGWCFIRLVLVGIIITFLIGGAATPLSDFDSQVHALTRPVEFEFVSWTLGAMWAKFSGWGISLERFLSSQAQSDLVLKYLNQLQLVNSLNAEIYALYTNPNISSPEIVSQPLRHKLEAETKRLSKLTPLAEGVLQNQLMRVIEENGLAFLGQATPPSLFRISDIPQSLIISPRSEINRELDVSLTPGISIKFKEQLEDTILNELDRSALVVPIGGIGTYPTMVMQTTDLLWLTDTIAHEWIHNYLSLRPLGINYFSSSELRTINETTASLAGTELGWLLMKKYYPEHIPTDAVSPRLRVSAPPSIIEEPDPNLFNFQIEMRETRVEADRLLAKGDILGAEAYMEARRQFFWQNGYQIRKINQAYFAFHGAYSADPTGGAAGEDPIGPAVQALYLQYPKLADFLKIISSVTSVDGLFALLNK